jgi:hypothetical protein
MQEMVFGGIEANGPGFMGFRLWEVTGVVDV